jgi:phospholipid N-methyltransferase
MPNSSPIFDSELELYFREVRHRSVLDIGAGEGKYGEMLRRVQPETELIAVELDPDYVEAYKLRGLYDEVWGRDAADLMNDLDRTYDAVILGDCIEHMRKSVGVDLLNFLVYRSRIIVVKFPVQMIQDPYYGHKSEAHVSVWSEHDFRGMDCVFVERDAICLALVRGYLNQTLEWLPDAVTRRFGYASMAEFYARDPARLALADVESRRQGSALAEIRRSIPAGATYILVDELQTRLAADAERRALPFLEKNGEYWGLPGDSQEAIREIERMRESGCTHIVFAWPAFWWLDHYREMTEYLRTRSRCVLESDRLRMFDLRE